MILCCGCNVIVVCKKREIEAAVRCIGFDRDSRSLCHPLLQSEGLRARIAARDGDERFTGYRDYAIRGFQGTTNHVRVGTHAKSRDRDVRP
jgi:hypothetical protein